MSLLALPGPPGPRGPAGGAGNDGAAGAPGADGASADANALSLPATADPLLITGTVGATVPDGTNRAVYGRIRGEGSVSKLAVYVSTSSGNICVAIYANSGVGYAAVPAARLATSGAVACPTAGVVTEIALDATIAVTHGDHWFALSCDNVTAKFYIATGSPSQGLTISQKGQGKKQASAHPLPNPAASLAEVDRTFIIVGVP